MGRVKGLLFLLSPIFHCHKIKDGGYKNVTNTNKVSPTQNAPALQATIRHGLCFRCCNQLLSSVMWSLRFPFFWSCVCHCMRFTTLRSRPVSIDRNRLFLEARPFDSLHRSRCRLSSCVSVSSHVKYCRTITGH